PRRIIALDVDDDRLAFLQRRFAPLAESRGVSLDVVDAREDGVVASLVEAASEGRGADDVVMVAASADLVRQADSWLAPHGMLVLFAGLKRGTEVPVLLDRVPLGGAQYTGTSGSTMEDHRRVVAMAAAGELDPVRSLAAVAGLAAVPDGIEALMSGRYAGKIVILPRARSLPLRSVEELLELEPGLREACGPGGEWTLAAEELLAARYGA
ncbi:MAG: hypothetical protein RLZZ272_999, partial [Actinomycetota bacterium]